MKVRVQLTYLVEYPKDNAVATIAGLNIVQLICDGLATALYRKEGPDHPDFDLLPGARMKVSIVGRAKGAR